MSLFGSDCDSSSESDGDYGEQFVVTKEGSNDVSRCESISSGSGGDRGEYFVVSKEENLDTLNLCLDQMSTVPNHNSWCYTLNSGSQIHTTSMHQIHRTLSLNEQQRLTQAAEVALQRWEAATVGVSAVSHRTGLTFHSTIVENPSKTTGLAVNDDIHRVTGVFSSAECDDILRAINRAILGRGGWDSDRHPRYKV
jgi:hypothetical protein